jgi:hypothetical protein
MFARRLLTVLPVAGCAMFCAFALSLPALGGPVSVTLATPNFSAEENRTGLLLVWEIQNTSSNQVVHIDSISLNPNQPTAVKGFDLNDRLTNVKLNSNAPFDLTSGTDGAINVNFDTFDDTIDNTPDQGKWHFSGVMKFHSALGSDSLPFDGDVTVRDASKAVPLPSSGGMSTIGLLVVGAGAIICQRHRSKQIV